MFTYSQAAGVLSQDGSQMGVGYSGHGAGLNNSAMQTVPDVGPVPQGLYSIGPWHDAVHLGPCVALLTPIDQDAFGRTAIFVHGDDSAMDHGASHGCIILGPTIRRAMRASGDTSLTVTE